MEFKNHKNVDIDRDLDGKLDHHDGADSRNRSLGDFFNFNDVIDNERKKPVSHIDQKIL